MTAATDAVRRQILAIVDTLEGGVAANTDGQDPGGWTARGGLTQGALDEVRAARGLPPKRIQDAGPADLAMVQAHWWQAIRGEELVPITADTVVGIVYDAAWNQGVGYAIRLLQWAVGAPQDGVIGPRTLEGLRMRTDREHLGYVLLWGRLSRYRATVRYRRRRGLDPWVYFEGWMTRLDRWEREVSGIHATPP